MTLYERKPPVVDAEQWDGTLEGFENVRRLFVLATPSIEYFVQYSWDGNDPYVRVYFSQPLYSRDRQQLQPFDWVLLTESGKIEWLDPEAFEKIYKEIGE